MSEENIKIIEEKNDCMWFRGSPVMICAYRVAADMQTGDMFTSAKIVNIKPAVLDSVTFDVICYDQDRKPVGRLTNITFGDLGVTRNTDFGYQRRIELPDPATRNVEYIIRSTSYENGEVWRNTQNSRFDTRIDQESIYTVQGDCNKQFLDICARSGIEGLNLVLQPVFEDDHWLCACGAFNWGDEEQCSQCGANREWLRRSTDIEMLKKRREDQEEDARRVREEVARREAEAAASRAAEQEEFKKRSILLASEEKKVRIRKWSIGTLQVVFLLIILAVALYLLVTYVFPKFMDDEHAPESTVPAVSDISGPVGPDLSSDK